MTKRFIVGLAFFAVCGPAWPYTAAAQGTINEASVSGRVIDPQRAVVVGAHVTARQTETNLTAEAITDDDGRFRFPYLKVGPYEFIVRQPGFADDTRALTLTVGAAFELPVSLAVGGVNASVTVTGQATVLDRKSTRLNSSH